MRDFDRPLKKRGREAAEQIGKVLAAEKLVSAAAKPSSSAAKRKAQTADSSSASAKSSPPLVISSPAARARETTALVLKSAGLKLEPRFDERIYEADVRTLLEVVASMPDKATTAMLVGHNPGFENLLSYLTGDDRHMPTAALAKIEFDTESWSEVAEGAGTLASFVTPKGLSDD